MTIIVVFGGFTLTVFTLTVFTAENSFATSESQTNLAVGVIGKDIGDEISVGAVYIFDDSNDDDDYYLTKTMTNPHELSHGQFGQFITYHDAGKLAITAPWKYDQDDNPIGEIYLLDGTTGKILSVISNPNPYDNRADEFGITVAFVGDNKIAVGAPVQPANGQHVGGMVYLFDADTGNLIREITDSNSQERDAFGHSVASLGDNKIAVGIPGKDVKDVDFAGAVSIFDANTGLLVKTIKNPEPDGHDEFGKFITSDIDNNRLLVGAHHRNVDGNTSAGAVYLFDADTGSLALTIHNPDPDDDAYFGKSVLLADDKIVVGAPGSGTFERGSVYIFDADTGKFLETIDNPQRIRPSEFGYTNEFGLSLAFDKSNNHIAIGDPGKIVDEILNVGGVYVYDLTGDMIQTIDNPEPVRDDSFGNFVAFVGMMESSFDDNLTKKIESNQSSLNSDELLSSSTTINSENISENDYDDNMSETKSIKWIDEIDADYTVGGFGLIEMVHPDLNISVQLIDIPVLHVWSDTDPQGIQIDAIETGPDTGVFYADVDFSDEESSYLQIHVSNEDRVIVSFEDNYHLEDVIRITAKDNLDSHRTPTEVEQDRKTNQISDITENKSETSSTTPPLGIKIFEYGMFDAEDDGDLIHQLYVGKKYWFEFEYQNELEASYDIREFTQLIDQNKTENNVLKKIEGFTTVKPSDRLGHGFEWTPEHTGQFKITSEVVSINNSHVGVIAPQYDLVVVDRPTLKQQITNAVPTDDILCNNSNNSLAERANKELACVDFDTAKRMSWKLVHFEEIILDPATKESLLKQYRGLPEVVAFYEKYENAQSSVREDHISYFVGNQDEDYKIRMNLELDNNHNIENIEFHCYSERVHQVEVAQDSIITFLKEWTCDENGANKN